MTLSMIITVAAGLFSAIGLGGVLIGASFANRAGGRRSFLIGSAALTLAGLVMLLAGLTGIGGTSELFGGFMLLIFGTTVTLPIRRASGKPAGEGRA